jgi:Calcineurin-like phosphoesterase
MTSSRESTGGAGWGCSPGSYTKLMSKRDIPFSWLSPRPLWQSRNDPLARIFGDPTNGRRRAWMKALGGTHLDLRIEVSEGRQVSFLVLGDTGEGDASQYAVVPPLLSQAQETSFTFICSDVIYPAGGIDAYTERFFAPYRDYPGPIYAVPGNHDWYDDCTGFMYWFCGATERPPWSDDGLSLGKLLLRFLWRRPPRAHRRRIEKARAMRSAPSQEATQPGPYLVIDAGPLRLVGIDTGIEGDIDREQGEWLRRVSAESAKPKILLTGKPIYVDGEHRPGAIEGGGTVDEIVTAREHNYIAAIGGDIHNYQRYPVELGDGRTLLYLVSGGGGAFMHETHTIPNLDTVGLAGVTEAAFRSYPLRGDSLSRFSKLWSRKGIGWLLGARFIDPDVAASIVAERLGLEPVRESAQAAEVSEKARRAAKALFSLPGRRRGALHLPFSEYLDWNQPPLFKSFLRIDADADRVDVRCFAATGCGDHEHDPPVEDELRAQREDDGTWTWSYA